MLDAGWICGIPWWQVKSSAREKPRRNTKTLELKSDPFGRGDSLLGSSIFKIFPPSHFQKCESSCCPPVFSKMEE